MSRRQNLFANCRWPTKLLRVAKGLRDERSGATYILVATSMTVMMGMAGLGFDATIWYKDKRDIQTVADLAVLGGLHAMLEDGDADAIFDAADEQAERNGFVHETTGTLTVNNPPLYGKHIGDSDFIEVIVDQPRELNFASFFLGDEVVIQARAVAGTINGGDNCVLALDETADDALLFTGDSRVISKCGVASNSVSNTALSVQGSGYVEVSSAQAFGDVDADLLNGPGGDKGLYATEPNQALSVRIDDPYADTVIPTVTECDETGRNFGNEPPLAPGVYCGNVKFQGAVTLQTGVYIIYGGDLSVNAGAFVTATGPVTFIFTHENANQIGAVNKINGNAVMLLEGPDADGHDDGEYQGEYGGMLFIQDPRYSGNKANQFNGGATMNLSGAIYAPGGSVMFNGGSDAAPGCLQIVALTVTFSGNSGFGNTHDACEAQGVKEITQKRARLIE